jgi:hypothetical protein
MRKFLQGSVISVVFVVSAAALMSGQTNVTTWHNDNARDGLNSTETVLNQSNVNSAQFGKICSAVFDGQVFAQPLVVQSGGKNIVYVATMNDSVYSVDGTNCNQINQVSLLQAGEESVRCTDVGGPNCYTIKPATGILGTPVIDTTTNTMYLVTETELTTGSCSTTKSGACFTHRLHALDLTSLAEKFNGPVTIAGTYQKVSFTSKNHIQRPGLLLIPNSFSNGDSTVYVGFSEMDGTGTIGVNIPRGWVFGFDAGNLANTPLVWSSTPAGEGGGVWMAGAGLAAGVDSPGGNAYLYFITGDGDFNVNTGGSDYGDSFVKLTTSLTTVPNGYFTPYGQNCMDVNDVDFGSGGVMLLPDSGSTYFAVAAGKDANIYVMNRANPGGYTAPTNSTCPATGSNTVQEYFVGASGRQYYSTAVYWNSHLFYAAMFAPVIRFQVSLASPPTCNPSPICQTNTASTGISFQYGPSLSISASGNTTGTAILWAVKGNGWPRHNSGNPSPAILHAFDAEHLTGPHTIPLLWNSNQCPTRDQTGNATKFVVPTIANGFVYLGTMDPTDSTSTRGELDVFGPTSATCN